MRAIPQETVQEWRYWRRQVQYHQQLVRSYLSNFHAIANPVRWRCLIHANNHARLQDHAELMASRLSEGGAR